MEVTIDLPEQIFASISLNATKSHKRVDELIVEHIQRDFSAGISDLEREISHCSDDDVLRLSKIGLPPEHDRRLTELIQLQGEKPLPVAKRKELWKLMEQNRLVTLKKAFSIREISRRKLNGTNQ